MQCAGCGLPLQTSRARSISECKHVIDNESVNFVLTEIRVGFVVRKSHQDCISSSARSLSRRSISCQDMNPCPDLELSSILSSLPSSVPFLAKVLFSHKSHSVRAYEDSSRSYLCFRAFVFECRLVLYLVCSHTSRSSSGVIRSDRK